MDNFGQLFTPLNKQYCWWFYYLSVIGFVFLFISIITMLFIGISKRKDSSYFVSMFFVALGYFIFYFQNRLLYSMCIHSA